ncbi:MAG: Hsp20/alpha crystallin family protein [Hamadaea sp.]|uniref:Hsp20/alpha crystallin family protein n=1 Tax=Hamadaea sp. TaxID=2024425 RepID=UPI00181BF7E0|nr:Hsp20/alpha crystallin family protein [Hamadaea sp.]NUR50472.1 Hsp20/alpha crystallin family protein [Hamadaea sp.]NUR74196.1 Hsp20/alpha crystallin family protein [Hamadaea sp.]NUT22294.1 Hsp20/alpha crystallin family protein [Hamadaea sp.]
MTNETVEVRPTERGWEVVAALPGVAPEEVAVEVADRELRIVVASEDGATPAALDQRVKLPEDVDPDHVDATMDHGLLTVRLPRSETLPEPIPGQIATAEEQLDRGREPAGGYPTGEDATGKNVAAGVPLR